MAITDLGSLTAGGSRATNQATISVTTTAAVAIGELVVVTIAVDNVVARPSNDDLSISTVYLQSIPLVRADSCGPDTAAQTGPSVQVWYAIATNAVASGQNITVTFASATTSDHSALTARHFSVAGGVGVLTSGRQYVGVAADYPSMDVTTSAVEYLRIRGIGVRRPTGTIPAFGTTAGWTGWSTAFSGSTTGSPDWEIFCNAESVVFTGTNKISDPDASGGNVALNANVYVVLQELPLSGTMAATESGSDSASFSGGVGIIAGTLEAYEGAVWLTANSTLYTADDDVTRVNSATILRDTANFAGQVVLGVSGTLAATDGADTAVFAGLVGRSGVFAATESIPDTALFAGTVAWPLVTGTLVATESADTAAFTGFAQAFGTLAATEAQDTAAFAGGPVIGAVLAATEVGDDTADFTGVLTNAGVLAAVEDGQDTAAFEGFAYVAVTLAATEAPDVPAFTGYLSLVDEKVGTLDAHEDRVGGYSEPRADSTLVTADNTLFHVSIDYYGQDRALFNGAVINNGVLAATEAADTASFAGTVPYVGVLAATEAMDTAAFSGTAGFVITGVLAAREARDIALFSEAPIIITGVLAAHESADTAYFSEAKWEDAGAGNGLRNELQRMIWLAGRGGRVTWLENEVEETVDLQNIDPEVVSLVNEVMRITELRP